MEKSLPADGIGPRIDERELAGFSGKAFL